ncbi:MAG TPA: CvpA family protein [Ktedonobacteraceae bacterium]|nr:CvpA family protein [Ktedonobacteraceae bacterium]
MIGPFNWIDLLFLITIALLVFNGIRNGAIFSIVNLLSIPVALGVAIYFGKPFTLFLASNGLSISPIIAYIILFFGAVLIIHILGTMLRGVIRAIPLVGLGDVLIGGLVGFVEAWLLWLIVLLLIGSFLHNVQDAITTGSQLIPGFNIKVQTFQDWRNAYNVAVTNSLFAKVNGFFISTIPALPKLNGQ